MTDKEFVKSIYPYASVRTEIWGYYVYVDNHQIGYYKELSAVCVSEEVSWRDARQRIDKQMISKLEQSW